MGKRIMAENDYNWSREIHLQAMKGSRCIIRRVDLVRCLITSNVYNSGIMSERYSNRISLKSLAC